MAPTRWQAWRTQRSTQKPQVLREVCTKPAAQRASSGRWGRPTSLHDAEGRAGKQREDPHTDPAQQALACGAGRVRGQKHQQRSQVQGGSSEGMLRGPPAVATEIDVSDTAEARRTAHRRAEPIDSPKPTSGLCAALQTDEIQLPQPEQRHKLPQPGKHHRTLIQPQP